VTPKVGVQELALAAAQVEVEAQAVFLLVR